MKTKIDNYVKGNLETMQKAVEKNKESMVIIVDGKSGKGKTTFSLQLGKYLDENLSLDDLYFSPDKFLNALTTAKQGQVFIFDEAMIYTSRKATSRENVLLMQALSMIRSKQVYLIFNINSIFDLDKNIVMHRAHFLFHLYGKGILDKGRLMAFFKSPDGQDKLKQLFVFGKKNYSYKYPKANYYCRFSSEFVLDESDYNKKKDEFVNKFLMREKTKDKDRRNDAIIILNEKYNLKPQELSEVFNLSLNMIYRILRDQ